MSPYWSYKTNLDFAHRMRDPVYGFIPLTKLEMAIIDTPVFQRLRRVHQLALTKYVYPSAEHSRFVHSIGVMHCASLIYEGIFNNKHSKIYTKPDEKRIQILRLAALLHDIGHLPFSHAAEELILPKGITHETIGAHIITQHEEISKKIERAGFLPGMVAMLLTKTPTFDFKVEHDIISGNLDADRADYLLRDSKACGVNYGEYDFARFLQMFAVVMNENGYDLVVAENDLCQAESMLIARYHYNLQVPYHRTRSGFDSALRRFIKSLGDEWSEMIEFRGADIKNMNFEQFINFDDYSIIEKAKKSGGYWADYVLRKKHLYVLLDTTSQIEKGGEKYRELKKALNEAGFKPDKGYFSQEKAIPVLKGSASLMEEHEPGRSEKPSPPFGSIYLICKDDGRLVDICERSWIFRQFKEAPLTIFRIYVTQERKKKALEVLNEVLKRAGEGACS